MARSRTSRIWLISKDELIKLIEQEDSISDVLRILGYNPNTGIHKTLQKRCEEDGIDLTEIKARGLLKVKKSHAKAIPLEEILIENSTYYRGHLKDRLIKEQILEEKCNKCGMETEWQGEKLVLVLDHINGKNNDHRIDNLRLLCPNCNSQTKTFAGRNAHNGWEKLRENHAFSGPTLNLYSQICIECNREYKSSKKKSKYCSQECVHKAQRKVEWPSKEIIENLLENHSMCGIGRMYGVSDNAVRNWAKHYNLI